MKGKYKKKILSRSKGKKVSIKKYLLNWGGGQEKVSKKKNTYRTLFLQDGGSKKRKGKHKKILTTCFYRANREKDKYK